MNTIQFYRVKSIYVDRSIWESEISVDDFIVTIGAKQSNSVYHIISVNAKPRLEQRTVRYYLKVLDSDLPTALKRDAGQQIIPVFWYKR